MILGMNVRPTEEAYASSDPARTLGNRTIDRALSSMLLIRRVLVLLVLRMGIRTSIRRKHIVASASASLMHRECVRIIPARLYRTTQDGRDCGSSGLQVLSSTSGEESDGKKQETQESDASDDAAGDSADVAFAGRWLRLALVLSRVDFRAGDVVVPCFSHVAVI